MYQRLKPTAIPCVLALEGGSRLIPRYEGEAAVVGQGDTHYLDAITAFLPERRAALVTALAEIDAAQLAQVAQLLVETLRSGHKVLTAGNGGSAAEAQHLAAELVGRFRRDRQAYGAVALSSDTSILTALANDYGYEEIFARQVEALGETGDLLIAFSTSGESENLVRAARAARGRGIAVVALTGDRPSRLQDLADLTVRVPSPEAAVVQEIHLIVTHLLCSLAESELSAGDDTP